MARRKKSIDKWRVFIAFNMVLLLLVESVRVVQEFDIRDSKVLVLMLSSIFSYFIKTIIEEFRKNESKK